MSEPLLSEERLTELALAWMRGDRTKLGLMALMRTVERETAEACAKICDVIAEDEWPSGSAANACSNEISRRVGA